MLLLQKYGSITLLAHNPHQKVTFFLDVLHDFESYVDWFFAILKKYGSMTLVAQNPHQKVTFFLGRIT